MSYLKKSIGLNKAHFRTCLLGLVSGVVGSISFQLLHNHTYPAQKFGVIRVSEILQSHMKSQKDYAPDNAAIVAKKIEQAIQKIQRDRGVTLFVKKAVVSDLPDYTLEISSFVSKGGSK